ncbi:MAG TPA: hypothetical protein VKA21_11350, partial [Candidatus Binatia bacterium]|nr:hypothetical protein [Candidatus Binatia bacterium]
MVRRAGTALIVLGALLVGWVGLTMWQGDPFTSLYTRYEQHGLAAGLAAVDRHWAAVHVRKRRVTSSASVRRADAV